MKRWIFLILGFLLISISLSAQIRFSQQVDTVGNYVVTVRFHEREQAESSFTSFACQELGFRFAKEYSSEKYDNYSEYKNLNKSTIQEVGGNGNIAQIGKIILSHLGMEDKTRAIGKQCMYAIILSRELEFKYFNFTIYFKDAKRERPVFSPKECIEILQEVEEARPFASWDNDIDYINFSSYFVLEDKERNVSSCSQCMRGTKIP